MILKSVRNSGLSLKILINIKRCYKKPTGRSDIIEVRYYYCIMVFAFVNAEEMPRSGNSYYIDEFVESRRCCEYSEQKRIVVGKERGLVPLQSL